MLGTFILFSEVFLLLLFSHIVVTAFGSFWGPNIIYSLTHGLGRKTLFYCNLDEVPVTANYLAWLCEKVGNHQRDSVRHNAEELPLTPLFIVMSFRRAISLACGFAGGSAVLVCAAVAADKHGYFADRCRLRETLTAVRAAQPPAWPTANGWDYNWDK